MITFLSTQEQHWLINSDNGVEIENNNKINAACQFQSAESDTEEK